MNEPAAINVAELVAEHHAIVYRAAFRLSGTAADAEDLTQQTFLAAQRSLAQLRNRDAARAWLLTILRNCFLKDCRRQRPLSAESHEIDLDELAEDDQLPEPEHVDGERLQQALLTLTPEARTILHLFYFEELGYREIAAQLNIPTGTVMSRLARAKQNLRRRLIEVEAQQDTSQQLTATPKTTTPHSESATPRRPKPAEVRPR